MCRTLRDCDIFKFLEVLQNNPALFDTTSDAYKNEDARVISLNNFRSQFNIPNLTLTELLAKIKTLKCQYQQQKKKIEQSFKRGAGAENIIWPTLIWFKQAQFLDTRKIENSTESNSVDNADSDEEYFGAETADNLRPNSKSTVCFENGPKIETNIDAPEPVLPCVEEANEGNSENDVWTENDTQFIIKSAENALKHLPLKGKLLLSRAITEAVYDVQLKFLSSD